MESISIELEWFSDPRRTRLVVLLNDEFKADGCAVIAWKLAQQYWFKNKPLIPEHAWQGANLPEALFTAGLAERKPSGIYVRGSSKRFGWRSEQSACLKMTASQAGKKSAEVRKKRYGSSQPSNGSRTALERPSNDLRTPLERSRTVVRRPFEKSSESVAVNEVSSPQNATDGKSLVTKTPLKPTAVARPEQRGGNEISSFIAAMVEAYSAKYKTRPILDGATRGKIIHLLKDYSVPRLTNLYQAFLQMDDPWFKTKMHDFETFKQNLQKVQVALDTGGALGREKTWQEIAAEQDAREGTGGIKHGPRLLRLSDRETEEPMEE